MREAVAGLVLLIPSVVMAAPANAPATGEKVTLAAAVDRALQRNPSVAVAVQEVERADALITQARAGWLPFLTGNGLLTRLDSDRVLRSVDSSGVQQFTLQDGVNSVIGGVTNRNVPGDLNSATGAITAS